jgi:aromatic-L-amino-acid decarboxylase
MRTDLLRNAIAADLAAGIRPVAVVATIGTTSSTSVDPIAEIADVCREHGIWLHVDAAYAGVTALVPECRPHMAGWDRADSIVLNPHKWLFVPFDLSAFYCRRMDVIRQTFSVIPDILRTAEAERGVRNLMDTGIQLGRRFRALKLWMVLRHFGASGIRHVLQEHMRLARLFAGWVDADPFFERMAPVPFSVVCFRACPANLALDQLDAFNERLVDAVNATGEVFLSHTRLGDAVVIRLAIGHLLTAESHVSHAWTLLKRHTEELLPRQ